MNLQPLKVLVPGRVMLVMLLLLSLVLGWYYVSSTAQGTHLVRRNFNHLNQITANIDASVTSLQAQVKFSHGMACPDAETDKDCIQNFKTRLASNSPLIRDEDAILIRNPETASKKLEDLKKAAAGKIKTLAENTCITPKILGRNAQVFGDYLVDNGIGSEFRIDMVRWSDPKKNEGRADEERTCPDLILPLDLSVSLFFEQVQGLSESEGYFDSIIIARATKAPNDGGQAGPAQFVPEIIYNSASDEPYAKTDKLQSIFRMRSGFERYRSISDLEQQHGVDRYRATLLPGEKGGKNPTEIESQAFTHSTVVPFEVGGFSHLAFVQPLQLGSINRDFLIIGVVEQSKFNALKYRVPLNYLSLLLVAFVLVLLSLNFIRLALIGKRGVLLKRDLHLSYISLVSMASLITILIGNIGASWQLQTMFDDDQQAIFDQVRSQFEFELLQKLALMEDAIIEDAAAASEPVAAAVESPGEEPTGLAARYQAEFCSASVRTVSYGTREKVFCGGAPVPMLSALFRLDSGGTQEGRYRTYLKSSPTPPFNVARRDYFRNVQDGETWLLDTRRLDAWLGNSEHYAPLYEALEGQRYFLQRIESYTDSTLETAISRPIMDDEDVLAGVQVSVSRFRSLEDIVLPAGFGLAVFESRSGRVLFHDDYQRSLRENFYRATDDNADLKAAVIAGVKMGLDLDYKGEDVHSVVGPLADTPWTLVVYYRKSLVDVINFHFGVTASILSAIFIILFLLGSSVLAWLVPRMIQAWSGAEEPGVAIVPDWIYPLEGRAAQYVDLTGMNIALLLLYTGITYHLDIIDSWPWLFAAPAVIFGLWHGHMRPEFYRSLPGVLGLLGPRIPYLFALVVVAYYGWLLIARGGVVYLSVSALVSVAVYLALRFNEARERRALESETPQRRVAGARSRDLINYRRASCVFVLMLSVSPTILLYNENFDVHEKLWVEYTNWYNSEQLRERTRGYQRYSRRTNEAGDLGEFMLGTWQGVYLPRTKIYGPPGSAPQGAAEQAETPLGLDILSDRWPQAREKYWLPTAFDEEFTLHMLVTRQDAQALQECHDNISFTGDAARRCKTTPPVDKQVDLLKSLVKALPSFSSTGLLLESFTERSRKMHAFALPSSKEEEAGEEGAAEAAGGRPESGTDIESGAAGAEENADQPGSDAVSMTMERPALVVFDEFDSVSGLHYLMSTLFPHTQSHFPQVILIPYLIFLGISGLFVYLLTGFLADRQLGGRFARRQSAIDREANHEEILAGGLMVVPAGLSLEAAYKQLASTPALQGQVFAEPEGHGGTGLDTLRVSDSMVILKDFAGVIDSRGTAARVVSYLEEALAEGKHIILLSDIDPKYWLRARNEADTLPTPLFHRWEALLMSLHSYCLFPPGRSCAVPKPGCFRRVWERCSKDERLLLAGLHYEQVVNYRNLSAGISLYRRGILSFRDFQFHFTNKAFARFVERQLPREQFRREAAGYENKVWLAFRGPIMLALLVTLGFIAYTAQDEMRIVFSILTTVSGTMVAVGALSDRIRDFRGYLGA